MQFKSFTPDSEASPLISESASSGLAAGVIAGLVASAPLVITAIKYFAVRRHYRNRPQGRAGELRTHAGSVSADSERAQFVAAERLLDPLNLVRDELSGDATSICAVDAGPGPQAEIVRTTFSQLLPGPAASDNVGLHEAVSSEEAPAIDAASFDSTRAVLAIESTIDRLYLPGPVQVLPALAQSAALTGGEEV